MNAYEILTSRPSKPTIGPSAGGGGGEGALEAGGREALATVPTASNQGGKRGERREVQFGSNDARDAQNLYENLDFNERQGGNSSAATTGSSTSSLRMGHWQPDGEALSCTLCSIKFGFITPRRHHCRVCGFIYCVECVSGLDAIVVQPSINAPRLDSNEISRNGNDNAGLVELCNCCSLPVDASSSRCTSLQYSATARPSTITSKVCKVCSSQLHNHEYLLQHRYGTSAGANANTVFRRDTRDVDQDAASFTSNSNSNRFNTDGLQRTDSNHSIKATRDEQQQWQKLQLPAVGSSSSTAVSATLSINTNSNTRKPSMMGSLLSSTVPSDWAWSTF